MSGRGLRTAFRVAVSLVIAALVLRAGLGDEADTSMPVVLLVLGTALGYVVVSSAASWRAPTPAARASVETARAFADVLALCAVIVAVGQPPTSLLVFLCAIPLGYALTLPANVIAMVTAAALVGAFLIWGTGLAVHPEPPTNADMLITAFGLVWSGLASCLIAIERERRTDRINELSGTLQQMLGQVVTAEQTESRRVADLLHDDVLQLLLVTRHDVLDALEGDDEAMPRTVDGIDLATRHLRNTIGSLRSGGVAARRLGDGMRQLGEQTMERRSSCTVTVDVAPELGKRHHPLILSLGRDLLREVERGSAAATIAVRVLARDGDMVLTVEHDDPRYPERPVAGGPGALIVAVEQRARAVHGHFSITRAGDGTRTFTVTVPLRAVPAPRADAARRPRPSAVAAFRRRDAMPVSPEVPSDVQSR